MGRISCILLENTSSCIVVAVVFFFFCGLCFYLVYDYNLGPFGQLWLDLSSLQ